MEVLKTSETLEKQILEDARKKASKVLESAAKECDQIRDEWRQKLSQESQRIDADTQKRVASIRQELASSLPLDFMRTRLAFIDNALRKALDTLFASLSQAELEKVLGSMLGRVAGAFDGKRVIANFAGLAADRAKAIVQKGIPGAALEGTKPMAAEGGKAAIGLVVETTDGKIRYRGTLSEMTVILMEENRAELVDALLGKDV